MAASEQGFVAQRPMAPRLSWPVIIGVLGFVLPLLRPGSLLMDPDSYLHVAVGRWIIAHRTLPFHDVFSYSMPGAAWVPHEWLAEVVFAALYMVGGWGATVVFCAACFGLSLGIFARRLMPHCEPFSLLLLAVLSGDLAYGHLFVRPHVLTFPILVAWTAMLIEARDRDRAPPFWLLPLMVLWANLHGGFMFGNALALYLGAEAVWAAGDAAARRRAVWQWGGFIVLAILAGLATPNGLAGFLQPFELMGMPELHARFAEWQPPDLRTDHVFMIWVLGLPILGFGLGLRLPITRLLLVIALYYETFQSNRFTDLLCWVVPLATAAALGPEVARRIRTDPPSGLARWMARRAEPGNSAGLLGAALVVLIASGAILALQPSPDDKDNCPTAALQLVRDQHIEGPVFNAENVGDCLLFNGIPPFIDGRMEMYGDAFLARWWQASAGEVSSLKGILSEYHVTWTLLSAQSGSVQALDLLPGWHRVYADRNFVIHVRDAGAAPAEK
jgi:hypothetical protein